MTRRQIAILGLILFYCVTRFLDLDRQSPWVDELANWETVLEPTWYTEHPLTLFLQKLFLTFNDRSLYLLRLPSAIVWAIATALLGFTVSRIAGFKGGLVTSAAAVFSGICLNFAQDANHYHFAYIASVFAIWSIERLGLSGKPHWVSGFAAALLCAVCYFGTPVSGIALAICAAGVSLSWGMNWKFAPGGALWKMIGPVGCLAAVVGAIVMAWRHSLSLGTFASAFELSPRNIVAIMGDFLVRYRQMLPLDSIAGFFLAAISFVGWFLAARRRPRLRPLAIMCVLMFITSMIVIGGFRYGHFVSSRYFIGILPWIHCGFGLAFRESHRHRASQPFKVAFRIGAVAYLLFFAMFLGPYYAGHYMNYRDSLRLFAEKAQSGDVLVTSKIYHSRAVAFYLRHVEPELKIHHVALDSPGPNGFYFLQQAREAMDSVHLRNGRTFLLYYLDGDHLQSTFSNFYKLETKPVEIFPSRSRSDFSPLRRDMILAEMIGPPRIKRPPAVNVPRQFAFASSIRVQNLSKITPILNKSMVRQSTGAAVGMNVAPSIDGAAELVVTAAATSPDAGYLLMFRNDAPAWVWEIPPSDDPLGKELRLVAPLGDVSSGHVELFTFALAHGPGLVRSKLFMDTIDIVPAKGSSNGAKINVVQELLGASSTKPDAISLNDKKTVTFTADSEYPTFVARQSSVPGLYSMAPIWYLTVPGQPKLRLLSPGNETSVNVATWWLMSAPPNSGEATLSLEFAPQLILAPRLGELKVGPLLKLAAASDPAENIKFLTKSE